MSLHADDDGAWHLHGSLAALEGAELDTALCAARTHLHTDGHPSPTWTDALTELARAYLGGRSTPMAARHQIIIHIDHPGADPDLDRARLHLGQRLPAAVVDRLLCDTSVRALIDHDGRPVGLSPATRTIPTWLRTIIEDRDRTCRIPGCDRSRWLEIHHITPVSDGGPTTPDNLIALCTTHHTAHHRGHLHITGTAHHLHITDPHGHPIGPHPPTPPGAAGTTAATHTGITGTYHHPSGECLQHHWIHLQHRDQPDPHGTDPPGLG